MSDIDEDMKTARTHARRSVKAMFGQELFEIIPIKGGIILSKPGEPTFAALSRLKQRSYPVG